MAHADAVTATHEYESPGPEISVDPGYKWRLAVFLFCASALNYGDRTAITALFPLLKAELGLTDVGVALVGSTFLWSYAICSPLAGMLADRVSRGRLVVMSLFAWSIVTALTGCVHSPKVLWTMRGLLGVVEAVYLPAAIALLADHHPVATRAKAIGVHVSGLSFGMVAGGTLSGYLATRYGWRVPLWTLGGLGVILATVGIFVVGEGRPTIAGKDEPVVDLAQSLRALKRALMMPSMMVLFLEYAVMGVGVWSAITWLPYYFNENFGMNLAKAALFGTLFLKGGAVLGVLVGGIPSDHVAKKHIGARMMLFAIFYLLAAPLMLVFLMHPTAWMVAAAIFLYGFVQAMGQINSNPLVCELLPKEARSTGIGLTNMLACLAGGTGVYIAGALKSTLGLAGVFASITVVTALCGGMLMFAAVRWVQRDAEMCGAAGFPVVVGVTD